MVILPWKLAINKARGQEVGDHSINWTESRGESAKYNPHNNHIHNVATNIRIKQK